MKGNIRNVITNWVKPCELIVNDISYPPQWSVGNFINPGGKTGRNFFQIYDGRVIENKGDIIEYKLIVKRIAIDNCCQ